VESSNTLLSYNNKREDKSPRAKDSFNKYPFQPTQQDNAT
jgi:hypothetical protein